MSDIDFELYSWSVVVHRIDSISHNAVSRVFRLVTVLLHSCDGTDYRVVQGEMLAGDGP
jgi:hypothetical protein